MKTENVYQECTTCTLPYIDKVNGREGKCDFCTGELFISPLAPERNNALLCATMGTREAIRPSVLARLVACFTPAIHKAGQPAT